MGLSNNVNGGFIAQFPFAVCLSTVQIAKVYPETIWRNIGNTTIFGICNLPVSEVLIKTKKKKTHSKKKKKKTYWQHPDNRISSNRFAKPLEETAVADGKPPKSRAADEESPKRSSTLMLSSIIKGIFQLTTS